MKYIILFLSILPSLFISQNFTKEDTLKGSNTSFRNFWNVKKYDIILEADYDSKSIKGSNKITFEITKDVTNPVFQIDLQKPMIVDKIESSVEKNIKYKQDGVNWQLYKGEKAEQKYVPTLMFINDNNGKCQEAMDYYINIFPNSKINTINYYPPEAHADAGNIVHAQFTINNYQLFAMDSAADYQFNFSEANSLVVMTADQEETDRYWEALVANGGSESQCGWLKDRYGLSWQIVPHRLITLMNDPDHQKAQNVVEAMLKMRKIIISDLERAFKD